MNNDTQRKQQNTITNRLSKAVSLDDIKKAELRRQMYERIAEGNRFAEIEVIARRRLR